MDLNNRKVEALEKISKKLEDYVWNLQSNCYCACDLPEDDDEEEDKEPNEYDPQHHDDCPDAIVPFMARLIKIARDALREEGDGNG